MFGRRKRDESHGRQPLNECPEDVVNRLRLAARVYDVVKDLPTDEHGRERLRYASRLLAEQRESFVGPAVLGAVGASLAGHLIDCCERTPQAGDVALGIAKDHPELPPYFSTKRLSTLRAALDSHQIHTVNTAAVSAVLESMFVQLDHVGGERVVQEALSICCAAAHDNGLTAQLQEAIRRFENVKPSPGYVAVRTFYRAQVAKSRGDFAEHETLRDQYVTEFAGVTGADPAARHVEHLGRWVQSRQRTSGRSIMHLAAEAAESGDLVNSATYYGRAVNEAESPDQAARFRIISEGARLKSGQLETPQLLHDCLTRLAHDHVTLAAPLLNPDLLFVDLCAKAIEAQQYHRDSHIALQVADFAGDVLMGVSIDHRFTSLKTATAAMADISIVDARQRDPEVLDVSRLKSSLPGASFVWVSTTHDVDHSYLNILTLPATEHSSHVRTDVIPDREDSTTRIAIGRGSEQLTENELQWLSDVIFGDLSEVNVGSGVYVIPDQSCWELPWARIAPAYVSQIAAVPSAAAAMRLSPLQSPGRRKSVVGLFNEDLRGAVDELDALRNLADIGLVDFVQARSADDLRAKLAATEFDLLVVSAHGTRGEGFEFEIELNGYGLSLLELLDMRLPPEVSLGCCWSARSTLSTTSVVAVMSCLLAGSSSVVGGLWDLDDVPVATVLSAAYGYYANGTSLAKALRMAFESCPRNSVAAAGGLSVVGRW